MELIWTNGQLTALDDILKWSELDIYQSDDDNVYTLSGAAGTGKTTVVQEMIRRLKRFSIMVSAPTHKAKEVISDITKKPGVTIHSLLGLRPNIDLETFDPNNPTYQQMAEEYINNADIHIIDECSMINKDLFKMLVKKANQYKKRIIFVGDEKQLPPVNEKLSRTFVVKHKYELTEIVRQRGDNPNQSLLTYARADVATNTNQVSEIMQNDHNETNVNSLGIEQGFIVTGSQEKFYNKLIELYSDTEVQDNMNFIKTLVYTNIAAKKVNKFIKDKINPSPEIITVGDILLGYKTVIHPISERIVVQNSKDYKIFSLEVIDKKIQLKNYKFFRVVVNFITKDTIDILHPESYKDFHEVLYRLYINAKQNRAWRPFYKFREQFVLMEDFFNEDGSNLTKKDIDLGYAMTIHKSWNNLGSCKTYLTAGIS